ncbi:sentrin-specific protease 5-like [Anoplopoma fimbria]|uniref:sentrin-specific protease 5-like n=1 Tax=Anoplopoma fimbria TaxID=229290 RepID=UPI0023EDC11E|nr:sentrin-specific protease 5-like [Anoplopoma fimbria]XP_054452280.1 sentrin-specific protease 5-like [Anoplopoma fimbria]XP_054452281.1 sentrin-specific protease 5-like [Anoplopoma fimbria]XP_054452282.1 sentrin-specific protease 5-like [Anoplopoma fimbria]
MHRTQSHRGKAKYLKKKKGFLSSVKGVSHLSRRAKRRMCCKLQLWMWRKRREKCHFGTYKAKKRACGISSGPCHSVKTQSQKINSKDPVYRTPKLERSVRTSVPVSPLGCDTGDSDTLRGQNSLLNLCDSVSLSETLIASTSLHNLVMNTNVSPGKISQIEQTATVPSQKTETSVQLSEITDPLKLSHTVKPPLSTDSDAGLLTAHFKEPRTMVPVQRLDVDGPSGQFTAVTPGQDQDTNRDTDERITCKKTSQTDVSLLRKEIHEFLEDFYRIYGGFIPLRKRDVLRHLERKFNTDFSDRKNVISSEVLKCRTEIRQKPVPYFQVVYKKHTLTLDDLSTLAYQNWLNDQVMNMYGELILESAHHKVHFLNSFFHRQLMTKGYEGVKRWTKQVDLFSKSLLLVPIHLEVHWCLVTADIDKKKICLYDSQGIALQKVARNILKYLMTEAKEKKHTDFESGWEVSYNEIIPQQTNENDCGVFVLEYCRCLALAKPLQFSQRDIPKIRKRIYKELCDCKLHEQG